MSGGTLFTQGSLFTIAATGVIRSYFCCLGLLLAPQVEEKSSVRSSRGLAGPFGPSAPAPLEQWAKQAKALLEMSGQQQLPSASPQASLWWATGTGLSWAVCSAASPNAAWWSAGDNSAALVMPQGTMKRQSPPLAPGMGEPQSHLSAPLISVVTPSALAMASPGPCHIPSLVLLMFILFAFHAFEAYHTETAVLYSQLTQTTVKSILVALPFNKSACSTRNNNHRDLTQRSEGIWICLVRTACVLQ